MCLVSLVSRQSAALYGAYVRDLFLVVEGGGEGEKMKDLVLLVKYLYPVINGFNYLVSFSDSFNYINSLLVG